MSLGVVSARTKGEAVGLLSVVELAVAGDENPEEGSMTRVLTVIISLSPVGMMDSRMCEGEAVGRRASSAVLRKGPASTMAKLVRSMDVLLVPFSLRCTFRHVMHE